MKYIKHPIRDGRPRSIEGFLKVLPVFKGPIDLEKGIRPRRGLSPSRVDAAFRRE